MTIAIIVIVILIAIVMAQAGRLMLARESNEYLWFLVQKHSDNAFDFIVQMDALEQRNAFLEDYYKRHQAILTKHAPHLLEGD